ncbi:MAG: glycosyl transferase group 1 [Planctomycetaceae bacterium]|nr:glycosyl transferase group 1 [Planctomycetaceae bacterium]
MSIAEPVTPIVKSATAGRRALRVCHVSLTLKTGGLERLLADIARYHDVLDCVPEFVALNEVGRFADVIREAGCTVHQLKPSGVFGHVRQLARLFRAGQFDVVHTHNTYPHIYGSIAAKLAGVPVVVNTRHGQRAGGNWKTQTLFRWSSHLVNRIVAVSDDAAQLCIKTDGVAARKVTRIWNGIDIDDFNFAGPVSAPVAISVARLSAEKDFPTLLRALSIAIQDIPDLVLKLVGDGPERSRLELLARELNLAHHIEFLGERSDVPALLTQSGFFVTATLTEGISLTLLEAMAVGLPVLATSVGGNSEIVQVPQTGRLVPPGDPAGLAAAMVDMCRQMQSWHQMGRAGRERVEEHFEVRRMVSDYERLYRDLLAKKA